MNRIAWLLTLVLCSTVFMYAGDSSTAKEMNGTICDAQCVTQQSNLATCDTGCTTKSGEAVFVSDAGTVMKVANQDICQSHMGKHVKARGVMDKDNPQIVTFMDLQDEGGIGH